MILDRIDDDVLRPLIDAVPGLFVILDERKRFVLWNAQFERASGYGAKELTRMTPRDLTPVHEQSLIEAKLREVFRGGASAEEISVVAKDGTVTPYFFSGRRVTLDGRPHVVAMGLDISERRFADEQFGRLAHYDGLTNLANRNLLVRLLDEELEAARGRDGTGLIVLLDIDRFKAVNDSLGHHFGDTLLQLVTQRLLDAIGAGNTLARHGGDEFVALFPNAAFSESAAVAARLLDALRAPFEIAPHELHVTCSAGICAYPAHGSDAATLLRNADAAMYAAKAAGRNTFRHFTPEMSERATRNLQLANELHRALANDELAVHYQPMFEIGGNALLGYEALVRWNHPYEGTIVPDEFIAIAEDVGLIERIGTFVLDRAMRQLRAWHDAGHAQLVVAVNVSAQQLLDASFVSEVQALLERYALPPECVELELTENVFVSHDRHVAETLAGLSALGLPLVIDDFGTGYSSLGYLRRLPVRKVKLDRSFVWDLHVDAGAAAIVAAVVSLARTFGFTVLAEGVETREALEAVRDLGCDQVQGYLFGHPLPPERIELHANAPRA